VPVSKLRWGWKCVLSNNKGDALIWIAYFVLGAREMNSKGEDNQFRTDVFEGTSDSLLSLSHYRKKLIPSFRLITWLFLISWQERLRLDHFPWESCTKMYAWTNFKIKSLEFLSILIGVATLLEATVGATIGGILDESFRKRFPYKIHGVTYEGGPGRVNLP